MGSWRNALVAAALLALLAVWVLVRSTPPVAGPPQPEAARSDPSPGEETASWPEADEPAGADSSPAAAAAPPAAAAPQPEPPGPGALPLESLLRLPAREPGAPVGLDVDRNPHLRAPAPGSAAEASRPPLRDRVRVDHRSESAGVPGPREKTLGRTEADVRVPVKDSVDLRGGVRVDSRQGDGTLEELEPTPSVGVDVRF